MLIAISEVQVGKRLRRLRESAVVELMDSIQRLGLQTPITVSSRPAKREGGGMDTVAFDLVAGQHRLESCKRLGWQEIEASIVQMSEDERVLWEIDENLCRADLTELERGEHLAKRKVIYEKLYPYKKAGVSQATGMNRATGNVAEENFRDVPTFAEDAGRRLGLTDRSIRQSVRRVEKIDPKIRDRIRDNPEIADSGIELDALAQMDAQDQKRAVALVESGQAAGIRDAKKLMEPKPPKLQPHFKEAEIARQKRRDAFTRAWNALDEEDREWARGRIDTPVADNTTALRAVQ